MNYRHMIAKAILANRDNLLEAIEQYIAKADNDLTDNLKSEGYLKAEDTVKRIDSLQEDVAAILQQQTNETVTVLASAKTWKKAKKKLKQMMDNDTISEDVRSTIEDMLQVEVSDLATAYIQTAESDLVVETLLSSTSAWITSWSAQLGELMRINTHEQLTSLIQNSIDNGESIVDLTRKIQAGGWRDEYYQARRVAVTEVLRAHSVAHEEAIQQSPATDRKEWVHTGAHKNKPRPNHVAMNGQIVNKDEPFTLTGKDGTIYYPLYPRDATLPASESVNCHCLHRGIVNDSILGMSYEERKKMQEEIVQELNKKWENEQ